MTDIDHKYRISQIYSPQTIKIPTDQDRKYLFPHDNAIFYAYGRHALFNGLKSIGVTKGDKILIPSLVCRDLLSSLNQLGIYPVYYDVDKKLNPKLNSNQFASVKAVLVINYFGFPQNLIPIFEFCEGTGCILIEDNAHGFLSRDNNGEVLGTRGDLGIFSFRKTVPLFHGAALYIQDKTKFITIPGQLEYYDYKSLYYSCKEVIRKAFPIIGISGIKMISKFIRLIRKLRTGHFVTVSDIDDEICLPIDSKPSIKLLDQINKVNVNEEINRRREIYNWLNELLAEFDISPVFSELPKHCVPYTFPFYCSNENVKIVEKELFKYGLEIFNWPELPREILSSCPQYYSNIWCVRFLW